ncbi:unnamed protein product [Symbiodinium sp. CCMP2592]|nr:unnamed protein product [Symbiodinium sp. CCMP2592]
MSLVSDDHPPAAPRIDAEKSQQESLVKEEPEGRLLAKLQASAGSVMDLDSSSDVLPEMDKESKNAPAAESKQKAKPQMISYNEDDLDALQEIMRCWCAMCCKTAQKVVSCAGCWRDYARRTEKNCPPQCLKHRAVTRAYGQDGWGDYLRGMDPDTAKSV